MNRSTIRLPYIWGARRTTRRALVVGLTVAMAAGLLASTAGRSRAAVPVRCHPQAVSLGGGALNNYYLDDGRLMAAGDNFAGQLGDGTLVGKNLPVEALNLKGLTSVASSPQGAYALALNAAGDVYSWGENDFGQLGNGEAGSGLYQDTPQRVNGVDEVVAIAAGQNHSLALTEDGTVWAWGANYDGQLGDGGTIDSPVPVQVLGLTDVVAISAGSDHSLAATTAGDVWAWGDNNNGKLGLGYVDTPPHALPEKVPGLSGVVAVAGGGEHSLALKSDGTAYGWGEKTAGAVGDGTALVGDQPSPVQVTGLSSIKAISAGYQHSMALETDGTVWTWGFSSNGQLGNGWYGWGAWTSTPMQVSGLSSIQTIATPHDQSIAVHANGTIYAWGENFYGQLGLGDYTDRANPTALSAISQAKPTAPQEVAAVAGEELALVTWEPPDSTVTQYVVTPYKDGVAQTPIATELPKLEYAAGSLVEGASYDFEVEAQNCLGTSPASDKSNRIVPTGVQLRDEGFSLERQRINDRHALKTNVFNGNLKLSASDLAITGTGLNVGIERAYSSRSDASGIFGNQWSTTVGTDVYLEELASGSVYLHTGGGAYFGFADIGGGSYDPPAGIDATLTQLADGTYKLQYHFTDEVWEFDADGKLETRIDRNGNQISFTYDILSGLLTTLTDTQGRSVVFTYTSGRVTRIDGPLGRVWEYAYDAAGNLTTYTDPEGNDTTYTYDTDGNLTAISTPGDQRPSSLIGTRRVEFTYDASSRVTTIRWPQADGSPMTSFDYQMLATIVTDGNGGETTYRFDEVGRTEEVVDSLGNSVGVDYTSNSNVQRHSIGQATTTYGYSNVNALTSQSFDTGARYTLTYGDSAHPHLPTLVEDPQDNQTALAYDTPGNLVSTTNDLPADNQVGVDYNSQGRPTQITDAMRNTSSYGYDAVGNLTAVDPPTPLGDIDPITYDAVSRIASVEDGKGNTTSYEYDKLDRVTKIDHGAGPTYTYEYDDDGNAISMTGPSGTTTMEYDERNLLVSRTTPDGHTITYDHDGMGNLASIAEDGNATTYSYSAANLLSSVTGPDGASTLISYDRDYNRTAFRYPNGVSLFSEYDDAKRLTKVSAHDDALNTLMSFEYSYEDPSTGEDSALRQSITDHDDNTTRYQYDALNRLVRATTKNADGEVTRDEEYAYDGNSNRVEQTIDNGTATLSTRYLYNPANQLINADGLVAYSYDANGNYSGSSHGERFIYNTADQTVSVRTAEGVPGTYQYLGPGQAERTKVNLEDVPLSTFTHNPLGISSETVGGEATTYFVRDDRGQILAQHGPTGVHYYLTDGLGSTTGLADEGGDLAATYRYDGFGNLVDSDGLTELTRFRYAGQYLDHTGLYKMGQRYYDPTLGRWTQQDPVYDPIDPKQWNRYVYTGGDPVNFADPSGLCGEPWWKRAWDGFVDVVTDPFKVAWSAAGIAILRPLAYGLAAGLGWGSAAIAVAVTAAAVYWTAVGRAIDSGVEFQYERREPQREKPKC